MQPKLTGDTCYVPVDDGVYFRNNRGALKLKGRVIYDWIERLAPLLDGQHTLEEITSELDTERQAMITNLVHTLLANHFIKDMAFDRSHTLSPAELEAYAAEIAFIDSFQDSAAYRFERFRDQKVLIIGSGSALTALVRSIVGCGLRQLGVLTTCEEMPDLEDGNGVESCFSKRDPQQSVIRVIPPDWNNEAEVCAAIQPFKTILHVSLHPMLARAKMLNRLCIAQEKIFMQALFVGDHGWIGPLIYPEANGCWECAWRRLQANLDDIRSQLPQYLFQDEPVAPTSQFIAPPTIALAANRVSFELFKYFTQAGSLETVGSLIDINLETLRSQTHPFLPHPHCDACQHPVRPTETMFLAQIQQLQHGEPLDPVAFSKQAALCFEKQLGLFNGISLDDFSQLPLAVSKVALSNPMLLEDISTPLEVREAGVSFSIARRRATQRACEMYAASIVNRQRLFQLEERPHTAICLQAPLFKGNTDLTRVKEWTWAYSLHTRRAYLVPAPLVYSTLRHQAPLEERGVGSGESWTEAICMALLDWCKHLTFERLSQAQEAYPQVDLAATALYPESTRQRRLLDLASESMTIYDVTGPLQVPTFAICMAHLPIIYSSHFDMAYALRDGIERAIQQYVAAREAQTKYSLPRVPDLPSTLRGDTAIIPDHVIPQTWNDRRNWLQQILQKEGWEVLVVPLDQDPVLTRILPYIARVLLARI